MSRKRAPGPYNYDDDEDYVPSKAVKYSEREDVGPKKVKKHTLDSDEEEDEDEAGGKDGDKNYDILKEEDIDGERLCLFYHLSFIFVFMAKIPSGVSSPELNI